MVLQFIFLFLARPIFQETSAEIDVKKLSMLKLSYRP